MSESEQVKAGATDAAAPGGEPSMEDILASIRRILAEEEAAPPAASPASPPAPSPEPPAAAIADDVLQLYASMMLPDTIALPAPEVQAAPPPPAPPPAAPSVMDDDDFSPPALREPEPPAMAPPAAEVLLAPETADAAATSVGSLVRTLAAERAAQVYRGGPTLEDMVRGELRPLLKQWLDDHLPGMVERLVRAEIERVVARAAP
jgi:hypothetical protein